MNLRSIARTTHEKMEYFAKECSLAWWPCLYLTLLTGLWIHDGGLKKERFPTAVLLTLLLVYTALKLYIDYLGWKQSRKNILPFPR